MRTFYTSIVLAFLLITAGCAHNDQLERDLATGTFSCSSRTTYLANGRQYKTPTEACKAGGCNLGCYYTLMCGQNEITCEPGSNDLGVVAQYKQFHKTPEQLGRERAEEAYRQKLQQKAEQESAQQTK